MSSSIRLALLLCSAPLTLAQTATIYDDNGNPVSPSAPGSSSRAAPGDLWRTISHSYSDTRGVAPYQGGLLVSPGNGFVYHISEVDGSQLAAFPVANPNDSWLGYDVSRDLIITTNAFLDVIRGYTPGNATPVFDMPTPTAGPVGMAWDSTRDEYVYCDWVTDQVVVLDATTLTVSRTFDMTAPALTRMAGVAYDCIDDVYVVGDRDTRSHYIVDPLSGATSAGYLTAAVGTSVPQGAALSVDGGIWAGDFQINSMALQEAGHSAMFHNCANAGIGTNYCAALPNSTGMTGAMSGAGSASVAMNQLTLTAASLPANSFGFFLTSQTQGSVVMPGGSQGTLCLSGSVGRYVGPGQIQSSGAAGEISLVLDLTQIPTPTGFVAAMPGQTWNFSAWHRDQVGGSATSNFADGLEVLFN